MEKTERAMQETRLDEKIPQTQPGTSAGSEKDDFQSQFDPVGLMPADIPKSKRARWEKLAKRAKRQAFAAIELKCIDCCGWERSEAKRCEITTCSLWALNRRIFASQ